MKLLEIIHSFKEGFCLASDICGDSVYYQPIPDNKDVAYIGGFYLGSLFFRRIKPDSILD